ncbi:hypothetical protein [Nodosilinea sp. LEGE 07088]|nr:hypothetical protein [Nodosilinea sp. LEGE 07088]
MAYPLPLGAANIKLTNPAAWHIEQPVEQTKPAVKQSGTAV